MKRRTFLRLSTLAPLALGVNRLYAGDIRSTGGSRAVPDGKAHKFGFADEHFVLDGQKMQIRSGQMDPIRIPRQYWRHRIRMARAMGLNTIACYLMWNAMESEPGHFDMTTGRRDFAHFIELCAHEGMWVYLRPGPYVCAEWDFGGLPAWLLRDPDMRVRDGDNRHYMQAVARYFDAVAARLRPLMVDQGGPVLMVQIENEYASFGTDLAYLETLQSMWMERGIQGPFSISDGLGQLQHAHTYVPGATLGLDGGADFTAAQAIAGDAPVWVGEGYTGWLTHWGDKGFQSDGFASELRKLMDAHRSFNLYEVNGGTNFGFGAGANAPSDGDPFQPVITSYDYGAPINERGVATMDYHRFRTIISGALGRSLPDVPAAPPVAGFDSVTAKPWASLWNHLPSPGHAHRPQGNEVLFGQGQGMVIYRKHVKLDKNTLLRIEGVHDYATVFVDGRLVGTISRVQGDGLPKGDVLTLPVSEGTTVRLDILIDSFGHVGYGRYIRDEKGLVGDVHLGTHRLTEWEVFSLPLDEAYMRTLKPSVQAPGRPGIFFRAEVIRHEDADCYVDMSAWDKGYVWVNGHLLGRYWRIGPQQRLYCPAGWWRRGTNEVLIFDQNRTEAAPIHGMKTLHGES